VSATLPSLLSTLHIFIAIRKRKKKIIFFWGLLLHLWDIWYPRLINLLLGKSVLVHDIFIFSLDQPKCFLLVNLDVRILHRKCKGSLTKGFCIFLPTFQFPREVQLYVYNNKQHKSCYRWMILKDVNVFTRNVIFSRKWIGVVQDNI